MHAYLKPFQKAFTSAANSDNAGPMAAYMLDQFQYLGIKTPERRALIKKLVKEQGPPTIDILPDLLCELWDQEFREYQYLGLDFLRRLEKKLTPFHLDILEHLILTRSWWDTVDGLAGWSVSFIFRTFPDDREPFLGSWRRSENIWLRRTSILFQLHYKDELDEDLLHAIIRENLGSKEFFINKAIGWILREHSKRQPEAVKRFVAETELAALSRREALKWLKRQEEKSA